MDKTGQVEVGKTPCVDCGRPSETAHNGEAYCMTHYIKRRYPNQFRVPPPHVTKLAEDHRVGAAE